MFERIRSAWSGDTPWPRPTSRAGRISLWLALAAACFLLVSLLPGRHHTSTFFLWLSTVALVPFLLVLSLRFLTRRLLWKVRNRLILTYVLLGVVPLVLFGILAAIEGYSFAGQFSINTALASLDAASDQIKGEASDLATLLISPEIKVKDDALNFEEDGNPREAEASMARLQNGVWHTITLRTRRGKTPPSPFEGQPPVAWLTPDFHGIVVFGSKLYLCYHGKSQDGQRSADTLVALELDHASLNSMANSLGRILMFSGFTHLRAGSIDGAEKQAESAETEADRAQETQDAQEAQRDAQRDAQREAQDRLRDAQGEVRDAQRDLQEQLRDAQREVDEAQRDAARARASAHPSEDDQKDAEQSVHEAQQRMRQAQSEAQKEVQNAIKNLPVQVAPPPVAPPPTHIPQQPTPQQPLKSPAQIAPGTNRPHITVKLQPPASSPSPAGTPPGKGDEFTAISGGVLPSPADIFDPRVYFTAPLPVVAWASGGKSSAMLVVISRPSLLYARLFASSVDMGSLLRNLLVALAIFFGILELLALWMATRLSRTITRSVAGLYLGTTEIDKGNLAYRVKPDRQDQLGALANSFNSMAGSIQDLLVQQREKERLLSELAIAQEVQRNLFPHSPAFTTGLQLHAVCVPARSVSGDYFDFIFGGSTTARGGTTTCIALGDISGKGISAALLMASLHSAVRAFSLGEEDVASPARLLDLLNRHLFRSTTPEKYATLFLAFYDAPSRKLTYANGGHLPPLILAADGGVQRLEAGGSVVGLLDNLSYGEATVQLQPGDLLVAYSDGLTEPENDRGEFGEERLLALLQQNRSSALPIITEMTFRTLREWIGDREQPDDMTLLLARQL